VAKGLPWVGTGPRNANASDQYTPPGGHPGPAAQRVVGDTTHENGPLHESLQGEQKPDQSRIGKRTYG